ncbi:carboxypeptidase-like regulatory domain-containing protein, partial [Bacteroidota bacterium]
MSGKIVDLNTNVPVEFAHVFLSNTTYGKTSDGSGRFYMDNLPAEEFILVVSIVGYETFSGKVNLTEMNIQNLLIKLKPKIVELEGVSVTGKTDKKWNRLYNIFKREFVGETINSKDCEIKNPWVVEFTKKSNNNNISVVVSKPIIIINRSLGYKVTYYLEEFTYSGGNIRFYGFTIFEFLIPADKLEEL